MHKNRYNSKTFIGITGWHNYYIFNFFIGNWFEERNDPTNNNHYHFKERKSDVVKDPVLSKVLSKIC